jgi:hypothetical protein
VLRNLLTESLKIPANFDYEVRPIQIAVNTANDWMRKNYDLLQHLQLLHDTIDQKMDESETEGGKESDDVDDQSAVENKTEVTESKAETRNGSFETDSANSANSARLATEGDLQALIGSAASLTVDFPTLRLVDCLC